MRNEPQGTTQHGEKERRRGLGRMDSWMDGALLLLPRRLVACEMRAVEILRFVARYKKRGRRAFVERRNQGGREKWWELS